MDAKKSTINIGRFTFNIINVDEESRKGFRIDISNSDNRFKSYFIGHDPSVILRRYVPEGGYSSKNMYLFDGANTYLLNNNKVVYGDYNDDAAVIKNDMGNTIAVACYYPKNGTDNDNILILFKDRNINICIFSFMIEVNGDNISTYINTQKRGVVTQCINSYYIDLLMSKPCVLPMYYSENIEATDELKYIVNVLNMIGITYLARNNDNVLMGFFEKPLYDDTNKTYISSMKSVSLFDSNKRFDFIGKNEYCRIFNLTKLQGGKPFVNIGINKASELITETFKLCQFKYVTSNQYGNLVAYKETTADGITIGMPPRCTMYKMF